MRIWTSDAGHIDSTHIYSFWRSQARLTYFTFDNFTKSSQIICEQFCLHFNKFTVLESFDDSNSTSQLVTGMSYKSNEISNEIIRKGELMFLWGKQKISRQKHFIK